MTRKAVALSLGLSSILSAATIAQGSQARAEPQTLVIDEDATDRLVSEVQRLGAPAEGVIDKMELRIGMEVGRKPATRSASLHRRVADLAVEEAKIQANGKARSSRRRPRRPWPWRWSPATSG